jgi:hypothetical protein
MRRRPLAHETARLSRADLTGDGLSIEIELGVLVVLGVEAGWLVLAVEHSDDDSKKHCYDRHRVSVAEHRRRRGTATIRAPHIRAMRYKY